MRNNFLKQIGLNKLFFRNALLKKSTILVIMIIGLSSCGKIDKSAEPQEPKTETKDEYFTIVVLPDTQYYTALKHGGTMDMFRYQIDWIIDNESSSNIEFVAMLGDISDHGNNAPIEFTKGGKEMYRLEAVNIPHGVAVGNHDQTPNGSPEDEGTDQYNHWFGRSHMESKPWYGGANGNTNNSDNHFDLFTACNTGFIVLYIEYNEPNNDNYNPVISDNVMNWTDSVLYAYPNRKAIIVSHSIVLVPDKLDIFFKKV